MSRDPTADTPQAWSRGDEEAAGDQEHWEPLCTLASEAEAQLMQGFLETNGVPCAIESLFFRAEPFTFGPLARVRLHVLRSDLERARELLAAADAATPDATEDDPDAG